MKLSPNLHSLLLWSSFIHGYDSTAPSPPTPWTSFFLTATSWAQLRQSWRWTVPGVFHGEPAAGSPPQARGRPPAARQQPSPRPNLLPAGGTACGSWAGDTVQRRHSQLGVRRPAATSGAQDHWKKPFPGEMRGEESPKTKKSGGHFPLRITWPLFNHWHRRTPGRKQPKVGCFLQPVSVKASSCQAEDIIFKNTCVSGWKQTKYGPWFRPGT